MEVFFQLASLAFVVAAGPIVIVLLAASKGNLWFFIYEIISFLLMFKLGINKLRIYTNSSVLVSNCDCAVLILSLVYFTFFILL
jgi:hypothetical protein